MNIPRLHRFPLLSAAGLSTATAVLFSAGAASAATPSSFAESRGYQNCSDAAARSVQLIKMDSNYFIYDHEDSRRFYLNGYAFRDGTSQPVKIACDTTASGNRVLEVSVDGGRYAGRVVDPVSIARN
jgi:hypothetical protein